MTAPDWSQIRRLLVVRLDNLGDVIMTGPALRAIKNHLPTINIVLLASPGGAPAAALLPWIDSFLKIIIHRAIWQDLGAHTFDPAREAGFIAELQRDGHDAALIFTSFNQSPHPAALACALAGIPVRIGESHERGHALTFERPSAPDALHQVERNLQLLEAAGIPVPDRHLEIQIPAGARHRARSLLAAHNITGHRYILINPFASCQARTYDPSRLARAARIAGERAELAIVMCGADRDRSRADSLTPLLGERGANLVGETDLPTFAALIADARLVMTQNTAALHLADALAVPQLVMYAGTELQSQWAPRVSPHLLLQRDTACSPCYRFECPYQHECLAFSAEEVAAAALRLLLDVPLA